MRPERQMSLIRHWFHYTPNPIKEFFSFVLAGLEKFTSGPNMVLCLYSGVSMFGTLRTIFCILTILSRFRPEDFERCEKKVR